MEHIKEIILCKYGEVILKGANRSTFEAQLLRDVKRRAALFEIGRASCRERV